MALCESLTTADLLGRNLRHVQNDHGGDETDTESGDQTASNHDTKSSGGSLEDTTNSEDEAAQNDSNSTTNEVGNVTGHDRAKEGTLAGESQ